MRSTVSQGSSSYVDILVDGRAPDVEDLVPLALVNDGHLTAMQVRGGRVRGLQAHLDRLVAAHREVYAAALDPDEVLGRMQVAAEAHPDCYLRVTVLEHYGGPRIVTVARPPLEAPTRPQTLLSVPYVRPLAHLKHVGAFGQVMFGRLAEQQGYDDAVLVSPDGLVTETTIANIGFVRDGRVVWPEAPALHGITWQLLDAALDHAGRPSVREPVRLVDVGRFDGALLANSLGVVAVGRIDDHGFPEPDAHVRDLVSAYAALPWDAI